MRSKSQPSNKTQSGRCIPPEELPTTASLWVYVQPRAGKAEVVGLYGDAVKIRLKAPPVDGQANEELIRFLAKAVGVPKGAVRIASGMAGRRKRVVLAGMTHEDVFAALGV